MRVICLDTALFFKIIKDDAKFHDFLDLLDELAQDADIAFKVIWPESEALLTSYKEKVREINEKCQSRTFHTRPGYAKFLSGMLGDTRHPNWTFLANLIQKQSSQLSVNQSSEADDTPSLVHFGLESGNIAQAPISESSLFAEDSIQIAETVVQIIESPSDYAYYLFTSNTEIYHEFLLKIKNTYIRSQSFNAHFTNFAQVCRAELGFKPYKPTADSKHNKLSRRKFFAAQAAVPLSDHGLSTIFSKPIINYENLARYIMDDMFKPDRAHIFPDGGAKEKAGYAVKLLVSTIQSQFAQLSFGVMVAKLIDHFSKGAVADGVLYSFMLVTCQPIALFSNTNFNNNINDFIDYYKKIKDGVHDELKSEVRSDGKKVIDFGFLTSKSALSAAPALYSAVTVLLSSDNTAVANRLLPEFVRMVMVVTACISALSTNGRYIHLANRQKIREENIRNVDGPQSSMAREMSINLCVQVMKCVRKLHNKSSAKERAAEKLVAFYAELGAVEYSVTLTNIQKMKVLNLLGLKFLYENDPEFKLDILKKRFAVSDATQRVVDALTKENGIKVLIEGTAYLTTVVALTQAMGIAEFIMKKVPVQSPFLQYIIAAIIYYCNADANGNIGKHTLKNLLSSLRDLINYGLRRHEYGKLEIIQAVLKMILVVCAGVASAANAYTFPAIPSPFAQVIQALLNGTASIGTGYQGLTAVMDKVEAMFLNDNAFKEGYHVIGKGKNIFTIYRSYKENFPQRARVLRLVKQDTMSIFLKLKEAYSALPPELVMATAPHAFYQHHNLNILDFCEEKEMQKYVADAIEKYQELVVDAVSVSTPLLGSQRASSNYSSSGLRDTESDAEVNFTTAVYL